MWTYKNLINIYFALNFSWPYFPIALVTCQSYLFISVGSRMCGSFLWRHVTWSVKVVVVWRGEYSADVEVGVVHWAMNESPECWPFAYWWWDWFEKQLMQNHLEEPVAWLITSADTWRGIKTINKHRAIDPWWYACFLLSAHAIYDNSSMNSFTYFRTWLVKLVV